MKVIFLDIDGVLNTAHTLVNSESPWSIEIDLERVVFLKEIVDATDAKIVLSSTWKNKGEMRNGKYIPLHQNMKELVEIFHSYGLFIYDITPKSYNGNRQSEICEWLNGKNVDCFIILDDDSFHLKDFLEELIKTSTTRDGEMLKNMDDCTGLCKRHVKEAIKRLNNKG